jgi:hypothetical protein
LNGDAHEDDSSEPWDCNFNMIDLEKMNLSTGHTLITINKRRLFEVATRMQYPDP